MSNLKFWWWGERDLRLSISDSINKIFIGGLEDKLYSSDGTLRLHVT